MSLTTLVNRLQNEPGVWLLEPALLPSKPSGDAQATNHGAGVRPAIPSFAQRNNIINAVDVVRLYLLASALPTPADKQVLTDAATLLYQNALLGSLSETQLVDEILGHWPLPAPSRWLLQIANAVDTVLTALAMPGASGKDLATGARNRLNVLTIELKPTGDGSTGAPTGGHGNN